MKPHFPFRSPVANNNHLNKVKVKHTEVDSTGKKHKDYKKEREEI